MEVWEEQWLKVKGGKELKGAPAAREMEDRKAEGEVEGRGLEVEQKLSTQQG
jgi:hypothetical protein